MNRGRFSGRSSRVHRSPNDHLATSSEDERSNSAQRPILIYDGSCGFCTRAAMWLSRHTGDNPIELRASQEMNADQFCALGLTQDQAKVSVWWIDENRLLNGHRAISAALKSCRRGWRRLGQLIDAPPFRWIGPPIYRQIARNRHLLPGATSACRTLAKRAHDTKTNIVRRSS